jgi:4'-phosphopantetheinyl transferase
VTANWNPPPARLALPEAETHVWRIALDAPQVTVECCLTELPAADRARAERFTFADGRRRYAMARAALRRILGRYLECEPASLDIGTGPHGKPFLRLDGRAHMLRFNLSHTEETAVLAVAWERDVGIDIESVKRPVALEELAGRFFSTSEATAVMDAPAKRRAAVFFRIWTTKEAYVKARGDGLALPLDQFDVVSDPGQPPGLLATRHDPADKARWRFAEVACGEEFACVLAVERRIGELRCWPFTF